jgi:hypothetical protein
MNKKTDIKIFSEEELNTRNDGLVLIHEGMN